MYVCVRVRERVSECRDKFVHECIASAFTLPAPYPLYARITTNTTLIRARSRKYKYTHTHTHTHMHTCTHAHMHTHTHAVVVPLTHGAALDVPGYPVPTAHLPAVTETLRRHYEVWLTVRVTVTVTVDGQGNG